MPPTTQLNSIPVEPQKNDTTSTSERQVLSDWINWIAVSGDTLMVFLGLICGFWIRFQSGWIPMKRTWWTSEGEGSITLSDYRVLIGIGAIFLVASFMYQRLYDLRNLMRFRRAVLTILQGATFWLFAYLGLSLALKFEPPISRIYVFCSYFASLICLVVWRGIFHRICRTQSVAKGLRQTVVFVGWNPEAATLYNSILEDPSQLYEVRGCVPSPQERYVEEPPRHIRKLGKFKNLNQLINQRACDLVVLTDLESDREEIVALCNLCEREMIQFKVIPSYFQILVSGLHLESISGVPILGVSELPLDRLPNRILKRTVDIVGSLVGLVFAGPLIAVFGILIYLESPGPIFYRQVRTGRKGREFKIIKIRSMKLDAEKDRGAQWATKDDPRRLRLGAFLREWNIDEIPQFWNVLKGDMSLVGPRPERPELIENFKYQIPHYNARHNCKPGITGWAQVNGLRGNTSLVERVRYDLWYLENWSLWLDVQIMGLTFVNRKNAY